MNKSLLYRNIKIPLLVLLLVVLVAVIAMPINFFHSRMRRTTEEGWVLLPVASGGLICQNLRNWHNGACYADARVYESLRRAVRALRSEFPGSRIAYMDASGAHRGRLKKHRSHGNGLNVDVQYLGVTESGEYYPSRPLWNATGYQMNYARDGRCGALRFDAQRNWRLLMALRGQSLLPVEAIFVEPYIREWLLKEGARAGADPAALAWARARLMNAGTSTAADHKDHFHVRFAAGNSKPIVAKIREKKI